MMKHFGDRHKDLNKGEDMHDSKALLERKGKKMMEKAKTNKSKGEKNLTRSKARIEQ